MPFKSIKQERFLWSQHPEIAQKWSKEFPDQHISQLPQYVNDKPQEQNQEAFKNLKSFLKMKR